MLIWATMPKKKGENTSCLDIPVLFDIYRAEFANILNNYLTDYHYIVNFLSKENLTDMPNCILAGAPGMQYDYIWLESMSRRFGISAGTWNRTQCTSSKGLPYMDGSHFIEIDLRHPDMPKDINVLADLIKEIITTKPHHQDRHILVLHNIDEVRRGATQMFRVLLERFSSNVFFLCTTSYASRLDVSLRSRLRVLRLPLPSEATVKNILTYMINHPRLQSCSNVEETQRVLSYIEKIETRQIDKAIYSLAHAARFQRLPCMALTFPPIADLQKTTSIADIRAMVMRIVELDIPFSAIAKDIIECFPATADIIPLIADLEHQVASSVAAREPFYIEYLLLHVSSYTARPLLKAFTILSI